MEPTTHSNRAEPLKGEGGDSGDLPWNVGATGGKGVGLQISRLPRAVLYAEWHWGGGRGGAMYQDVPMLDLDYPQLVFTIFPFPESDSEGFPFNPYRGRAQGCALGESSADGSGWPPDGL